MSDYKEPSDAEVTAFWPINLPLLRKWREAIQHVKRFQWMGGVAPQSRSVTEGSGDENIWVEVGTFQVDVPDPATDLLSGVLAGSELAMQIHCTIETDATATAATAAIRIATGPAAGDGPEGVGVVGSSSSNTAEVVRSVSYSGITASMTTFAIQANVDVTGSGGVATISVECRDQDYAWIRTTIG